MSTPQSTFLLGRFALLGAAPQTFVVDLEPFNVDGFFSLQANGTERPDIPGAPPVPNPWLGTVEATYKVSNNGIDFVTPTGAVAILTAIGDGDHDLASFSPPQCRFIQFIFTPDGADIEADFWLSMS